MNDHRTFPQRVFDRVLRIRPEVLNDSALALSRLRIGSVAAQLKQQTYRIKAEAIDSIC